MDIHALLAAINNKHNTHFALRGKYATGENQGAYALSDETGGGFVLKWNEHPAWLHSLQRARSVTNHLASRNMPVPSYVLADTHADGILYWIQTALPGAPPDVLSVGHAKQLVDLVEQQAAQALGTGSNWSAYVQAVVFSGHSGWQESLATYDTHTRAVLARLKQAVADKAHVALPDADICHGDMGTDNVLVEGDKITGIVDWDAAGEGDRALDLSKLLFYSYQVDDVRSFLRQHIVNISGQAAYTIYLAYNILAQLDWSIHHHSAQSVAEGVVLAHQILADLEATQ